MSRKTPLLRPELMMTPKARKQISRGITNKLKNLANTLAKRKSANEKLVEDPRAAAAEIGLVYVTADMLTLKREKKGKKFAFTTKSGKSILNKKVLERVSHLPIPPAWTDVTIAVHPKAHLQALGRDARGRKQYLYHPLWRTVRDITKFHRMIPFGAALSKIRAQVVRDLRKVLLSKENILAAIVRLLDETLIRVGNDEYAKDNKSYGLTTMEDRHVEVHGSTMKFNFKGKSGKVHSIQCTDSVVAKVVRETMELPGKQLFQYVDASGDVRDVTAADVNEYIQEITGEKFTAKDFRTWAGTVTAALRLTELEAAETKFALKKNIGRTIEEVSAKLGNTPAVCRRSYIHPLVLQSYEAKRLPKGLTKKVKVQPAEYERLTLGEVAVLHFLKECEKEMRA